MVQCESVPRGIWVHPLNHLHIEKGEFYQLYPDLRHFPARFFHYYQMKVQKFDALLEILKPSLERKVSNFRMPISVEQQLVLTLR